MSPPGAPSLLGRGEIGISRSPRRRASLAGSSSPATSPSSGFLRWRETAVFSGIPITERLVEDQRTCGVCAIDLATGQVVALLRFETAMQEVFAVTVLPGKRYPDLINDDQKLLENSFTVPDAALADPGLPDLALEYLLSNGRGAGRRDARSPFPGWLKPPLAPARWTSNGPELCPSPRMCGAPVIRAIVQNPSNPPGIAGSIVLPSRVPVIKPLIHFATSRKPS